MEYLQLLQSKKARQAKTDIKTMFIVFYDVREIVHREFILPGESINQVYHLVV